MPADIAIQFKENVIPSTMKSFVIKRVLTLSCFLCIPIAMTDGQTSTAPTTANRQRNDDNPEMMRHRMFVNRAHMQFTLDLMSSMIVDNFSPENKLLETFAFSPLSLQSTLMMMHLGSRGVTRKEISDALYLSQMNINLRDTSTSSNQSVVKAHEIYGGAVASLTSDTSLSKSLRVANQVFAQRDLIPTSSFESMLKQYHSSRLKPIDFSADPRSVINDWISKESEGVIPQFLSSPPSPTSLLMAVNVLLYQGDWMYRFNAMDTENDAGFRRTNGVLAKVPMMVGKLPIAFAYNAELKTTVVELPYKTARLGMFLLLPDEISGIFSVMRSLNESVFTRLITSMRKDPREGVNVRLPRFVITSSPRVTHILSNKMKSLFSPGEADLSGMFLNLPSSGHVDDFLHKVVLKVDEKGSIAAAASATVVERVGSFSGQYFEADHPFMFFLTDKQTGLILFAGVYTGPDNS